MLGFDIFRRVSGAYMTLVRRRSAAAASSGADPVQQLFLDKLREYRQKSGDSKLVDPSEKILKELRSEQEKLVRHYGGGKGVDMNTFPEITFQEPKLDPIDEETAIAEKKAAEAAKKNKGPPKK